MVVQILRLVKDIFHIVCMAPTSEFSGSPNLITRLKHLKTMFGKTMFDKLFLDKLCLDKTMFGQNYVWTKLCLDKLRTEF